jgi:hypothetical protein
MESGMCDSQAAEGRALTSPRQSRGIAPTPPRPVCFLACADVGHGNTTRQSGDSEQTGSNQERIETWLCLDNVLTSYYRGAA